VVVAAAGVLMRKRSPSPGRRETQPNSPFPKTQPKASRRPQQQPQGDQPKLSFLALD